MAKYTIELRKVCDIYSRDTVETWFKNYNLSDFLTPSQILSIEKNNMWSKDKLAKKIVDHYFMREIGFETPALFRHYAFVTMQELMEEKLPFIYSVSIEYDPLINVDYTESFDRNLSFKGENSGLSSSTSSSSNQGFSAHSDTPETNLSKTDILDGIYASNTDNSETSNNASGKSERYI